MEYRIKMIEKHNGDNSFIPQYLDNDWSYSLIHKIIFCIPLLFICMLCGRLPDTPAIYGFFRIWTNIPNFKSNDTNFIFHNSKSGKCNTKADAEEIIKRYKSHLQQEEYLKQKEEERKHLNRIRKVVYIKVK